MVQLPLLYSGIRIAVNISVFQTEDGEFDSPIPHHAHAPR